MQQIQKDLSKNAQESCCEGVATRAPAGLSSLTRDAQVTSSEPGAAGSKICKEHEHLSLKGEENAMNKEYLSPAWGQRLRPLLWETALALKCTVGVKQPPIVLGPSFPITGNPPETPLGHVEVMDTGVEEGSPANLVRAGIRTILLIFSDLHIYSNLFKRCFKQS